MIVIRLIVDAVGVAHRERLDVEVARAHEARDAVEDAGPVLDDGDEDVAAALARAGDGPRGRRGGAVVPLSALIRSAPQSSMRSDRPLPAGMIGKTFCSLAISNQTSAGPSTAFAASTAGRTSSGVVAFHAGIP